jgi:hypothetical protein
MLQRNDELWSALKAYLQETKSTGCGYIDLMVPVSNDQVAEACECTLVRNRGIYIGYRSCTDGKP